MAGKAGRSGGGGMRPSGGGKSTSGSRPGGGSKPSSGGSSRIFGSRPSSSAGNRPSGPPSAGSRASGNRSAPVRHRPAVHPRRRSGAGAFFTGYAIGSIHGNHYNHNFGNQPVYQADPYGNQYPGGSVYPAPNSAQVQPRYKCNYCGAALRPEDHKCLSCGAADRSAYQDQPASVPAQGAYPSPSYPTAAAPAKRKSKKKVLVIVVAVIAALALVGFLLSRSDNDSRTYTASVGETHHTQWFDFTVTNVKTAYVYDQGAVEYKAPSGYLFVLVDLRITNTYSEEIEMLEEDLLLACDDFDKQRDYGPVVDASYGQYFDTEFGSLFPFLEESGGYYYVISAGETKTGRLVFEIPENTESAKLKYVELNRANIVGDTFLVDIF